MTISAHSSSSGRSRMSKRGIVRFRGSERISSDDRYNATGSSSVHVRIFFRTTVLSSFIRTASSTLAYYLQSLKRNVKNMQRSESYHSRNGVFAPAWSRVWRPRWNPIWVVSRTQPIPSGKQKRLMFHPEIFPFIPKKQILVWEVLRIFDFRIHDLNDNFGACTGEVEVKPTNSWEESLGVQLLA